MAYSAEISQANPSCLLFVIDQSGSMAEDLEHGVTKASFLADVLNRTLMDLVLRFRRPEGVLNCLDVGVIAYSGGGVGPGFGGVLAGSHLCELGALAASPMRVEKRRRRVPDGIGGLVESEMQFPVWFDPQASGGTPMCAALRMAGDLLSDWCREHPHSFPPTVLHVTDGEATDGSPVEVEAAAARLMAQRTGDGDVLLFNLHVSGGGGEPVRFPAAEPLRLNGHARLLYRISSTLPEEFQRRAADEGAAVSGHSRGYVYNGRLEDVVAFFNVGARLRRAGGTWVKARAPAVQGPPSWLPPDAGAAPAPPAAAPPAVANAPREGLVERWVRAGRDQAAAPMPAGAPATPAPAATAPAESLDLAALLQAAPAGAAVPPLPVPVATTPVPPVAAPSAAPSVTAPPPSAKPSRAAPPRAAADPPPATERAGRWPMALLGVVALAALTAYGVGLIERGGPGGGGPQPIRSGESTPDAPPSAPAPSLVIAREIPSAPPSVAPVAEALPPPSAAEPATPSAPLQAEPEPDLPVAEAPSEVAATASMAPPPAAAVPEAEAAAPPTSPDVPATPPAPAASAVQAGAPAPAAAPPPVARAPEDAAPPVAPLALSAPPASPPVAAAPGPLVGATPSAPEDAPVTPPAQPVAARAEPPGAAATAAPEAPPETEAPPLPWPGRVVTVIASNVREAPNNNSGIVRIAAQGLSLRVYGRFGGWLRVGDGAGPWGWVHSTLVEPAS